MLMFGDYIFECENIDSEKVCVVLTPYLNLYKPIQLVLEDAEIIFAQAISARLSNVVREFPCNLNIFKNKIGEVEFCWSDL